MRRVDCAIGAVALMMAVAGAVGGWWIYAGIMGGYALLSFLRSAYGDA